MDFLTGKFSNFIATYGYLAVFLGSLMEGEIVVFVAGILVQQGHLHMGWVMFIAVLGGLVRDQGLFFLSRHKGMNFLKKFPKFHNKISNQSKRISQKRFGLALFSMGFRLLYGLRGLAPIILGASDIGIVRFVITNLLSTMIWAVVFGGLGYGVGSLLNFLSGALKLFEILVVCAILALAIGLRLYQLWNKKNSDGY